LLLLVEDAPELGLIVSSLGRRAGCEVAVCPDVPSGWDFLCRRTPRLLLLDVNLPGVSGLDLCRRARATTALAAMAIALFTHWGLSADVVAGLEAGADYVFSKDLVTRSADWQRRLAEVLSRPHGQRGPVPLTWTPEAGWTGPPADWVGTLNRALDHPSLRWLGADVQSVLLRRALLQALSSAALGPGSESWLAAGGTRLDGERVPRPTRPETVANLAVALADQAWRLLGTDASAAFRSALDGVLPGVSKLWPC
jgi:CheY-like chemotaxis protein